MYQILEQENIYNFYQNVQVFEKRFFYNNYKIKYKSYILIISTNTVSNKAWNENDAERLCKCAVSQSCEWITVHSMWVQICHDLLLKYTLKQYQTNLKKHKKSKRRGTISNFIFF